MLRRRALGATAALARHAHRQPVTTEAAATMAQMAPPVQPGAASPIVAPRPAVLGERQYASTRLSLSEALTLPRHVYNDKDWYDEELKVRLMITMAADAPLPGFLRLLL